MPTASTCTPTSCRGRSSARPSKVAAQLFIHAVLSGKTAALYTTNIADLVRTAGGHRRAGHAAAAPARGDAWTPSICKHQGSVTRGDLDYTALWILYTATSIAQIEVIGARLLAALEVIPQAIKLNPSLFATIYTDLLNTKKTPQKVQAALDAIDRYLADRAPELFSLVIEHLQEAGEARSCSDIENYFSRQYQLSGVTTACEYLADEGLIGKASLPVRLTKRSNVDVQEIAFFHSGSLDGKRR